MKRKMYLFITCFLILSLSIVSGKGSSFKLDQAKKKDVKYLAWKEKKIAELEKISPADAEAFRWTAFESADPHAGAFEFYKDQPWSKFRIENYKIISIPTADGIKLDGWFIPVENAKATIIVLHGYSSDAGFGLYQSRFLLKAGYQLVVYNARFWNYSNKPEKYVGFIGNDIDDVGSVIEWCKKQSEINMDQLGILGFSYGAEKTILAGAKYDDLDFVMFDAAPISDKYRGEVPELVLETFQVLKDKYGYDPNAEELDDVIQIENISPRPLLILWGGKDEAVSVDIADILFEAAGEPKTMHIFPQSGHCLGMVQRDKDDYKAKVIEFLDAVTSTEK